MLGHLVLDQGHDRLGGADGRGDPEQVEVRLVPGIVHARDHLVRAVALARHLADDHVVLVVAGDCDDEVRRACDARPLEDEELGRIADDRRVLEVLLELNEAVPVLLDDRHLVPHASKRAREVRADLATARDEDEHLAGCSRSLRRSDHAGLDRFRQDLDRVRRRQTVRRPSVE